MTGLGDFKLENSINSDYFNIYEQFEFLVRTASLTHHTTDCFDDRLLLRRQIRINFADKG